MAARARATSRQCATGGAPGRARTGAGARTRLARRAGVSTRCATRRFRGSSDDPTFSRRAEWRHVRHAPARDPLCGLGRTSREVFAPVGAWQASDSSRGSERSRDRYARRCGGALHQGACDLFGAFRSHSPATPFAVAPLSVGFSVHVTGSSRNPNRAPRDRFARAF